MPNPTKNIRIGLVLLLGIVVAHAAITTITPYNLLDTVSGVFLNHYHFIARDMTTLALHTSLLVVITALYFFLVRASQYSKQMSILVAIGIVTLVAVVSYPPVYDPIYYFSSSVVWLTKNVNPFQQLVSYFSTHPFPYLEIPIPHDYAYGPAWLGLTSILVILTKYSYLWFSTFLTLLATGSVLGASVLLTKLSTKISLPQTLTLLFFNPITLLFLLPLGNQEALISLLLVLSLFLVKHEKTTAASLILAFSALIKLSMLPVVGIIYLWMIGGELQKQQQRILPYLAKLVLPTVVSLLLVGVLFGFDTNYVSGLQQFIARERANGVSLSSFTAYVVAQITFSPEFQLVLKDVFHILLTGVYGVVIIKVGLQTLFAKHDEEGYSKLYTHIWLILLLSIFLTGIAAKPWYLIPPLVVSMLLDKRKQMSTILITILSSIGSIFLAMRVIYPYNNQISILLLGISFLYFYLIPILLLMNSTMESKKSIAISQ